jgi:hypothetical protein
MEIRLIYKGFVRKIELNKIYTMRNWQLFLKHKSCKKKQGQDLYIKKEFGLYEKESFIAAVLDFTASFGVR